MFHMQSADLTHVSEVPRARARDWRISGLDACRAPHTAVEACCENMSHLVTHYETWSPPDAHTVPDESRRALWVLPGAARLVIVPGDGQLSAMVGNRRYDLLPRAILFGPTSRATRMLSTGRVVTIGLSALGWAGLVGRSAAALSDRAVAAGDVLDSKLTVTIGEAADCGDSECLAERIDMVLAKAPCAILPDETLVRGLTKIVDQGVICVAEAAGQQLGVASHVVRRCALRHFGYPPKVLLNRRRFVRALERMIVSERGYSEAARHGYFDASHFIRDAKRFLGMTPRRFLALAS